MIRLKELREAKHMSQQAVADVFHVTQQTIFKYEHALAEPDLDVILHMADFFGTSVDYLIGKTDDPKPCSYVVNVSDNPELFAFIELYNFSNSATQKRLLTYIQKISNLI